MIDMQTIFQIHRLKDEGFSNRAIAIRLKIDKKTVLKYMKNPSAKAVKRVRKPGKLDPYQDVIKDLVKENPGIKAPVILQRLQEKGFKGEITILRLFLQKIRRTSRSQEPFIRFESEPGAQMQVDWGHFSTLDYKGHKRKLYALSVVECHSRMLYVTFTHSQKQEVLHQGLLDAFAYFGGSPKELVVDNMLTAVTERVGPVIRFNEAFLKFLLPFHIQPTACNIRSPHEKGKVEATIKYLRYNFYPARQFADRDDAQKQVLVWLDNIANLRTHKTTGKIPAEALDRKALTPLPSVLPDLRETGTYRVHKDFGIRFDSNVYTAPPWTVGKNLTVKADQSRIYIYHKERQIAVHLRSFEKNLRIENPEHRDQVVKARNRNPITRQTEVFLSLGQPAVDLLEKLPDNRLSLKKTIAKLLILKDEYGDDSLLYAINKAMERKLYGADYVENILYQEMTPKTEHPLVKLARPELNEIRLPATSLKEYDALALKRRSRNHGHDHK